MAKTPGSVQISSIGQDAAHVELSITPVLKQAMERIDMLEARVAELESALDGNTSKGGE